MTAAPLRLMIYDRTCTRGLGPLGLTHAWVAGGRLYSALGRFDAWSGVASWGEGLDWLAGVEPGRPLAEIQYWGHGLPGVVLVGSEVLSAGSLAGPLAPELDGVRRRLAPGGLWWFRTCSTFAGARGHAFASAWARYFSCDVAGHTHVIGPWQSGLHRLAPGAEPRWSVDEGAMPGASGRQASSAPWLPNTIHCLQGEVPGGW